MKSNFLNQPVHTSEFSKLLDYIASKRVLQILDKFIFYDYQHLIINDCLTSKQTFDKWVLANRQDIIKQYPELKQYLFRL